MRYGWNVKQLLTFLVAVTEIGGLRRSAELQQVICQLDQLNRIGLAGCQLFDLRSDFGNVIDTSFRRRLSQPPSVCRDAGNILLEIASSMIIVII